MRASRARRRRRLTKTEVVLDSRRRAGLAARSIPLDHDRPQSLRRAVDGCCEPGRSAAHDHRVVLRGRRLRLEPEQIRDSPVLWPHHGLAADRADRRQVVVGEDGAAPLLGDVRLVRLQPLERDLVAVEKAPQFRARTIPLVPEHQGPRRRRLGGMSAATRESRSGGSRSAKTRTRRMSSAVTMRAT